MVEPSSSSDVFVWWRNPDGFNVKRAFSRLQVLSCRCTPIAPNLPQLLENFGSQIFSQIFKCSLWGFFLTVFKQKMSLRNVKSSTDPITWYVPRALVKLNHISICFCYVQKLCWFGARFWIGFDLVTFLLVALFLFMWSSTIEKWRTILRKSSDCLSDSQ